MDKSSTALSQVQRCVVSVVTQVPARGQSRWMLEKLALCSKSQEEELMGDALKVCVPTLQ